MQQWQKSDKQFKSTVARCDSISGTYSSKNKYQKLSNNKNLELSFQGLKNIHRGRLFITWFIMIVSIPVSAVEVSTFE